ncbi:MAG: hypothetical protein H6686_06300 [Fibrobacteria bacterium]|nr:hypothetical protein [Fibrobacteria bacterium]
MKHWQEIEGGWTIQWMDNPADTTTPATKAPAKSAVAVFPSVCGPVATVPALGRWYATIPMDKNYAAGRLILRLAGANGPTRVYAAGKAVGDLLPPWLPAYVDLGAHAQAGKPLVVCVEVEAPRAGGEWPVGEGEALALGPVLHEAPKVLSVAGPAMLEVLVRTDFHTERARASIRFDAAKGAKLPLSVKLASPDGQKGEFKREVVLSEDGGLVEFEFEIPDPKVWSPEQPGLYGFEVLLEGGQSLKTAFGFSAPSWTEKGITFNETPLFVRGVRWDAAGSAGFLSQGSPKAELSRIKDAGFNTVFPCSAPFPESLVLVAQQLGIMVIQNLGVGAMTDSDPALERTAHHSAAMISRQENFPGVLAFVAADLPGSLLSSRDVEWLKGVQAARQEQIPKGWRKDPLRTILSHFGGTRLEVGQVPTQDPVQALCIGARAPSSVEVHRFRLPAPVSIQRQSFLSKHLHPRDPSDLSGQGLGDSLFWKKLHKSKTGAGKFFAARLGCPSILDPESTLQALGSEKSPRSEALGKLQRQLGQELAQAGLKDIWTASSFATSCQQVAALAVLRQADALAVNPRCCGILVNQWSDTPLHASGLVGLVGQSKPGFELFRKYHKPVRVIAEATVRTPYTMQSAAIRIHMANDGAPGEYSLLLRVKGNNGRIWHQESLPALSEGGISTVGKFEFPVGDERGSFTFDMQLSRTGRDVYRTEETFYVPPAVNLESASQVFRYLGDFPSEVVRHGKTDARAVLVNQVCTFDPTRLQELLDDAVTGLTVIFAGIDPDDARFLQKHGGLTYALELFPAASAGGEGFHFLAQSPLFARLPAGIVAGEVHADLLPAWSLARLPGAQVAAGFAQIPGTSTQWNFCADIQSVPHGKGRIVFHQYRLWDKLGSSALADALFSNLADQVREQA